MKLKVYSDRLSQPVRAVIIFCKVNGIEFEEVRVNLAKRAHFTPEFSEINPMNQLPAIVDGEFKLFESHANLIYLASSYAGVADHWSPKLMQCNPIVTSFRFSLSRYPSDIFKRSKIHSVLDWHHSNLRRGPGV
ncbi:Glutathione S-transferase T1 [Hibiscus syriacus]|uniref:Glutathione S-transferase T1 n=1 Tax=Hibiscus syriacus TaxID=106335 RepID=A0A6A3A023_HIBSY|nr:Glutathione S-transferase T1 [Hibiscus syriacus]